MSSDTVSSGDKITSRFFDDCAERGMFARFSPEDEAKLDRLCERWRIQPGHVVFEPGCGSGRLTLRLAAAVGTSGRVVACDLSPLMIEKARARKLPCQAEFYHAPATEFIGIRHHYDRIICLNAFPHFENPSTVLAAMAASLAPNGELWICHLTSREQVNEIHMKNPETETHLLLPDDTLHRMLDKAAFTAIVIEEDQDAYIVHAAIEGQIPRA